MKKQIVQVVLFATVIHYCLAVINISTSKAVDEASDKVINSAADSITASSEQKGNRREAEIHSKPQVIEETYLVLPNNKPNYPAPVYGAPSGPKYSSQSSHIAPLPPLTYGVPQSGKYLIPPIIPSYKPKSHYGPPGQQIYLAVPQKGYGPPKSSKPINVFLKAPSSNYGPPPSNNFGRFAFQKNVLGPSKIPKINYGPPQKYPKGPSPHFNIQQKPVYGPPKINEPSKPINSYGSPPETYIGILTGTSSFKNSYQGLKDSYGAPVQNAPLPLDTHKLPHAHPVRPPPPTLPEIKYDGWHPIPGLISKPPAVYGAPNAPKNNDVDLNINSDFIPPPLELNHNAGSGQSFSDSYTAPLNTVTGSGGVVSSSGLALKPQPDDDITLSLGLSSLGIQGGRESLSVTKSVDYDLSHLGNQLNHHIPQFRPQGGLLPPSGVYGAPPSSQYGTPLLSSSLPRQQVSLGIVQSVGRQVNQGHGHNHYPTSSGGGSYVQQEYGPPSEHQNLPLQQRPQHFQHQNHNHGLSDSYGAPVFSALTSPYENIPVSYDLTHETSAHVPVTSPGGNNQNCNHMENGHEHNADLEVALSQKSKTISINSGEDLGEEKSQQQMDEEAHAISVAKSIDPNSELIKSRDIDYNNIPLKGSRGTYTLSIQSSEGSGTLKSLPHNQILNEGILQSILNAIEQPQYNGVGAIRNQAKYDISNNFQLPEAGKLSHFKDSESQDSANTHVILEASTSNSTTDTTFEQAETTTVTPLQLLDSNEIAFYFRNNAEKYVGEARDNDNSVVKQNKSNEPYPAENKSQYESYVSFKTRNSDISYGNINSSNSTTV